MRKKLFTISALHVITVLFLFAVTTTSEENKVPRAPNGIEMPEGYKDWRLISSSHREDNNTLRVILGNDDAVEAARQGKTNPWPDGVIMAKLVWKDTKHPAWEKAIIPGSFVHAEFMFKDSKKHASTNGWGFARWVGLEQKPYGADSSFVQECLNCHVPVEDNDYVFTRPSVLP